VCVCVCVCVCTHHKSTTRHLLFARFMCVYLCVHVCVRTRAGVCMCVRVHVHVCSCVCTPIICQPHVSCRSRTFFDANVPLGSVARFFIYVAPAFTTPLLVLIEFHLGTRPGSPKFVAIVACPTFFYWFAQNSLISTWLCGNCSTLFFQSPFRLCGLVCFHHEHTYADTKTVRESHWHRHWHRHKHRHRSRNRHRHRHRQTHVEDGEDP